MCYNSFRDYFPIFKKYPELRYFDSASTTLKPKNVIDAINDFYIYNGLNIRSLNPLSIENNLLINETRIKTAHFINSLPEEIIFTKGATESLNILAQILSKNIKPEDEIITSELEHNSSLLPWMKISQEKKAKLVFIPLDHNNQITISNFEKVLSDKTKIIALTHISNTLGGRERYLKI
ncbi:aminotransferase class V-fold PLP-dependent enzyme [Candidatus Phytoplasma melaleucae]|uniref:Aminotransferase class V-fold PLP-dependent enzyme n=1 Tax=Candidatus Phytoplasma melaleucae TaxID=2982630 RepID=A0ABT9DDZ9_9MOLU|nr:aminotransferase class V-fold PLP-dependent enzyme ['Melaleuca sp.' phytoplasma]MDO8168241.1 aminotransferase class V-fold PLP-dependent enzyme ['Melaleuca sp.' phytoplasma]MDV3205311.1 aminotransferase class V-fold PLP-dependent enzyme [Weeping tea tree witches'-broom phytoplasma]